MKELHEKDAALQAMLPPQRLLPDALYVPSRFALPFEGAGKQCCFHTLTKQCIEETLPQTARAGEGFDELITNYFLVPEGTDESEFYLSVSALLRACSRNKKRDSFVVMPTLACNADCSYCYEASTSRCTMDEETADRVAEYIIRSCGGGPVKLRWIGGEPLLTPAIIDRICLALRAAGVPYSGSMVTNGSLLTPESTEKCRTLWNLREIQISLDGAEEDYIARKRYKPYRDEYHTVIENVNRLSAAGIPVTLRCNLDEENCGRAPRLLEDLKELLREKQHVSFYFALLNDARAGENDLTLWRKILSMRPLIREAGLRDATYPGVESRFRVNRCMADGGGVVIAPDGGLYACEQCPPGMKLGDLANGITKESANRFRTEDTLREKCRQCPFLPDCTSFSGCPVQDTHCREIREMLALETLKAFAEQSAKEGKVQSGGCL